MSVPATPTSRKRPISQGSGCDENENTSTGGWFGVIGGVMGELLQSLGIFGAFKRRGWSTGNFGLRSTANSPSTFSRSSSPLPKEFELAQLDIQNPCYLRIEGARPGRGHNFLATTLNRPAWCDTCAHLVFCHATTCANCNLTCHEQCQHVVSLDCKTSSSESEFMGEDVWFEDAADDSYLLQMGEEEELFERNVSLQKLFAKPQEQEELRVMNFQEDETEKHEGEKSEKEIVEQRESTLEKLEASALQQTVRRIESQAVNSTLIEEWVKMCPLNNVGLQISKEIDGGYRGCLRIHLNLNRPINIVAGTRPPSIYDILQEDRTLDKTLTSFYMPRDSVKAIHITSTTTTREVIVALLKKFKVVDNPQKFSLYERTIDTGQSSQAKLRRLSDSECPLVLAIAWNAQGISNRLVMQENDTADIQWDAFSLPELANFLRILDREEGEYKNEIRCKYTLLKNRIQSLLAKVAPVIT